MAKKRANNEGTVYKKPDGKWRAQITINGRRLSFTANSQRECLKWVRKTKTEIEEQGVTFKGMETPLKVFLADWLVTVSSSRALGTLKHYSWIVNSRIVPNLGNKKLQDLNPDGIQRFYAKMREQGRSEHQVHCIHKILRAAMNHAVKLGHISRNPVTGTTPPRPKKSEMLFLDDKQVQVLLDTALEIEDRFYPLYYLAIHTGMRQGEIIGLKWVDLDWDQNTLQVKRQVLHFKGGGYTFTDPKTKSGKRTIILGSKAMQAMKEHKETVETLRTEAGEKWTELDLIFPSAVGTPVTGSNIRRAFRKLLIASELPKIRFHDLRHTAASLMLNHGIPVLIASRRLGHSKPSITMDVYGHLMPIKQVEAANLLDNLMSTK